MQYFLKARFHFNKNQYADLMLIVAVAGTISQVSLSFDILPSTFGYPISSFSFHLRDLLISLLFFWMPCVFLLKTWKFLQLIFMPILVPVIGEEKLLSIGLLMGFTNVRALY
jgi:hypothetical protein